MIPFPIKMCTLYHARCICKTRPMMKDLSVNTRHNSWKLHVHKAKILWSSGKPHESAHVLFYGPKQAHIFAEPNKAWRQLLHYCQSHVYMIAIWTNKKLKRLAKVSLVWQGCSVRYFLDFFSKKSEVYARLHVLSGIVRFSRTKGLSLPISLYICTNACVCLWCERGVCGLWTTYCILSKMNKETSVDHFTWVRPGSITLHACSGYCKHTN
jgi:hypothetical protein